MKREIKGLKKLNSDEEEHVEKLLEKNISHIKEKITEPENFRFYIQTYSKEGKSKKTTVHIEVRINNRQVNANSEGWDAEKAVKDCFQKIFTQLEYNLRLQDQNAYREKAKQKPKEFYDMQEESWK